MRRGYREMADWMEQVEEAWKVARGKKAPLQSVYQRLDYQRELSDQDFDSRYLVLYNAAGSNVCAAVFDRNQSVAPFFLEHKIYWLGTRSAAEGHYLASVLNSSAVNEAIKPFQTVGLMGERDIEKKVL